MHFNSNFARYCYFFNANDEICVEIYHYMVPKMGLDGRFKAGECSGYSISLVGGAAAPHTEPVKARPLNTKDRPALVPIFAKFSNSVCSISFFLYAVSLTTFLCNRWTSATL